MSEQQDEKAEQSVGAFTLADPLSSPPPVPLPYPVPEPDDEWTLPNGFAHVFYGKGNRELVRPVILAEIIELPIPHQGFARVLFVEVRLDAERA